MITLRIEHKVADYDGWKKTFDSDPINRKKSGVKQHRIFRPTDDKNFVIIDLDFDNPDDANATRSALQKMLPTIEGTLIFSPQIKTLDVVEAKDL